MAQLVGYAQFATLGIHFGLDLLEVFARTGLNFLGRVFVEAVDRSDFVDVDVSHFLDLREAFDASTWPTISSTSSASMNRLVRSLNSFWRRSDSSASVMMSMSQPVSCEARRTF